MQPTTKAEPSNPSLCVGIVPSHGLLDFRFDLQALRLETGVLRLTGTHGKVVPLPLSGLDGFHWQLAQSEDSANSSWRIENSGLTIVAAGDRSIASGETFELSLPTQLQCGDVLLELFSPSEDGVRHARMKQLGKIGSIEGRVDHRGHALGKAPSATTLAEWFDALGRLNRATANTDEFFHRAADSILSPGGMDAGMVLLLEGQQWSVVGSRAPHPEWGIAISFELLETMRSACATTFQEGGCESTETRPSAVAAPVLDANGEVVGAVYGIRAHHRRNQRRGIRPLEAFFVQQVGDAVSAGMIRRRQESDLARKSILLEQSFPDSLIESLLHDPSVLDGHERELSVMFCDIRDFSGICDDLPSDEVYRLLSELMDRMTEQIRDHDGVVIDYFGDGLAAFWNAPLDQPHHADLACDAAKCILRSLDEFNEEWEPLLGYPVRVGIGIHTGDALVGNSGSRHRIKYGPRGRTVNLAERIESATKHFKLPLLVSETTVQKLSAEYRARRICRVRLPGFPQPVNLYQPLSVSEAELRKSEIRAYSEALQLFEQGKFLACCSMLEPWLDESVEDNAVAGALMKQSIARRDGNFDRRHNDDTLEFIAMTANAKSRM